MSLSRIRHFRFANFLPAFFHSSLPNYTFPSGVPPDFSLTEAILERRSVRKYEPEPLSRDVVEELLTFGAWAPTGKNVQGLRYVVVTNPEILQSISSLAMENEGLNGRMIFHECPTVVFCFTHNAIPDDEFLDTGLALQNIQLAAHAMGLGTCLIGYARHAGDDFIKEVLGLGLDSGEEEAETEWVYTCAFTVGVPKGENPRAPRRKDPKVKYIDL